MAKASQKSGSGAVKKTAANAPDTAPLFGRIQRCIDEKIRPFIQVDGGEIELVELTPEKVLKVRLHGACVGCMASSITLQYGVQNAINEEFPEEDIQLELVE
ncbi:NifU family protein [Candidatus Peregrinibacteria bacterium]|nr:NifU family protein [Candidatus Peregrinibacteria bacterium]